MKVADESERDRRIEAAIEKEMLILRKMSPGDKEAPAMLREAYTQGQRDGRLAMLTNRASPRDPDRELSHNQYIFTAADFREQVRRRVDERLGPVLGKRTQRIHAEAEAEACLAVHLIGSDGEGL